MNWPAVLLFLVSLSSLSSENACVNVTGCNGCGTSTISCSAAGLTEFPRFSAVDAALVGNLVLSANHLTAISVEDLGNFTDLEQLDLSLNDIVYIEQSSFFTDLSMISLADNPLHCDCSLRWLLGYLESLPPQSVIDAGTCETPPLLAQSSLITLNDSQLICECVPECGLNASCDLSSGVCECNPGYTGVNCSEECLPGMYGFNCNQMCTCEAGTCHHVNGLCTCLPDYLGENCSHDCSGAPDCAALGREICSLNTPDNTCGPCYSLSEQTESGNSSCVYTESSAVLQTTCVYTESSAVLQTTCVYTESSAVLQTTCVYTESSAVLQTTCVYTESSAVLQTTFSSPLSSTLTLSYDTSTLIVIAPTVSPVTREDPNPQQKLSLEQLTILLTCTAIFLMLLAAGILIVIVILCWKHAYRRKRLKIVPLCSNENMSQELQPSKSVVEWD